jgi:hypothetical protein
MMQSGWQRQMMMNRSNYPYFPMQQAMSRFQSPGSPSLFTGTGGSSVTGATFGDPRRQNQRPQQRTGPVPPEADSAQPHLFDRVPPRGTGPAWTPRTPAVPQPPTPAQLTSIQEAYQHGLETQQQLANFSQQSLDRVRRASMSPINRNLTLTQLHQQDPRAAMNIWNVLTRNQTTPFNPQSPSANIPLSQVGAQDPRVQGELNSMQLQNPRFQDPSLAGIANNPEYMRLRAAAQGGDNTAQVQLTQLENRYREGNPYRMTAAQLQNDPVFQLHSSMPLSDPLRQRADRIAGLVVNPQQWQQTQAQYQQHFSPTQQAARAGGGQVAQAPTPTAVPADQNFKAPTAATPAPAEETPKPAAPEPPPAATPPATPAATPDFKGVASASPAVASTGSKPETMIPTS